MTTVGAPAGDQHGGDRARAGDAGRAHVDDRCRRGGGVDRPAGRAGLPRVQSASPQGAELLPDHGAPGGDDPRAAREESVGERPRRESRAAVLARPVDPAGHAAAARRDGPVSHGWRVFPPGCAAVARGAGGRLRHQGAVLSLARSAAVHPGAADVATGRAGRHGLRRARGGDALGPSRVGGDLPQARAATGRRRTTNWICSTPTTATTSTRR